MLEAIDDGRPDFAGAEPVFKDMLRSFRIA